MRGLHRERVLAAHGIAVIAETKNGLLAVQPGDFGVSRALLEHGEYDWQQVELLGRLIHAGAPPGWPRFFGAAHMGPLLIPLVRASGTRNVLAYEPSPLNHELLTLNLK